MSKAKKLIEVALPIKEISAESVRDKSIRHGHISTLHLWWARRPLPVCRAVVFASLVPDPLDADCPQAFRDAVDILLGKANNPGDPYAPYEDIPFTVAKDPMDDNLRNRLMMFIGKFSQRFFENEKRGRKTDTKDLISEYSLIKWDNKNNEEIINKARKLIWVSHNSHRGKSVVEILEEFDSYYGAIKRAENDLYSTVDRHIETPENLVKKHNLASAIENFLDRMPKVFDPFAGGGAIPLEAARLGCRAYGNDINPVAHIIQKGSVEFPQKYGKKSIFSTTEFLNLYGDPKLVNELNSDSLFRNDNTKTVQIENQLAFDVEYYAKRLLAMTQKEVGHLYPKDNKGREVVAYYWVRVGDCNNPSCKAEIPLLKRFYLCNSPTKQVYLHPRIDGKKIEFEIKTGKCSIGSWMDKNLVCPCCGSTTSSNELKEQSKSSKLKLRMIAVIYEDASGKGYRLPTQDEKILAEIDPHKINRAFTPNEKMQQIPDLVSGRGWGIDKWSQLFSPRQLLVMQTFLANFDLLKQDLMKKDKLYADVVLSYLAIFIDRISTRMTSFGLWHVSGEKLEQPFGRQAIPMVFDFPESNPFCTSTGSAYNQLDWILKYIQSESDTTFPAELINASSGEKGQFPAKSITATITDPPYYDAIAYADLSDFFYVWLKRTLGDIFPLNFATPLTPKADECTALKHYHDFDKAKARSHFESKLLAIFDAIESQTTDLVSVMFAHQSTEAWTTLCNSILGARMNITGSWPTDTEMPGALKTGKSFLSSSVTVACRPSVKHGIGVFKAVKEAITSRISEEVVNLYSLGYRGADLLTACFGKAVSEFGRFEKVEKADGTEVTVAELLDMTRETAFNALVKGFEGDDFTKFYIGWLQLYGFTESDFDDAAKFTRVGLSIDVTELFTNHILIRNGSKQTLGTFEERVNLVKNLGGRASGYLIDHVHRAMALYKGANRSDLLKYISVVASSNESNFWRVVTSLCEILPTGCEDHKMATGLLNNKDSLLRDIRTIEAQNPEEFDLFN